jgi:hypothetical protein
LFKTQANYNNLLDELQSCINNHNKYPDEELDEIQKVKLEEIHKLELEEFQKTNHNRKMINILLIFKKLRN